MIKILNCAKKNYKLEIRKLLSKRQNKVKIHTNEVNKIIKDVKNNGDKALIKYEKKFGENTEIVFKKKKLIILLRN